MSDDAGGGRSGAAASVLAHLSFARELEPEALAMLAERAHPLDVSAEETVFIEGDPSEGLYLVERGWLKGGKIGPSGREQVLRYFGAGDAVNEVGLFLETPNPATLTALEESRVWLVPRDAILGLVDEHPRLLWPLTRDLARRLVYLVGLVEDLSLLPLEARVAKFLLQHAEGGTFVRKGWATQAELAARLGTVPDVLHRILRGLREERLIAVERQRIVVLDLPGLEAKARQDETR